mmetsp:Transcript_32451/g.52575  ORF Transcript_32451/g.52575 Transcript_32451/m.52575 type:complete len:279 (-) Transcript_32451:551-1387(-)
MTKRTPKISPILCFSAMFIVSIIFLVSGIGTLITDAFVWNAPKQLAVSFAALSGGAQYILSLSKLRTYIFEAHSRKKSKQSTTVSSALHTPMKGQKNQKAEEISQKDESSHMVTNPISQKQSRFNTEWRELSVSKSSKEVRMMCSPSSKTQLEWKTSSPKYTKTEHNVSNVDSNVKTAETLPKIQQKNRQGRVVKKTEQSQKEGQILNKLWYLIAIASMIIPVVVVLFIVVFFNQIETTKRVSEVHRESVEEYTIQVDVGFFVAMICNTYFLQYAVSN